MADQQSPMSGAFSNPYVDTVAAQVNEDFVTSQNERRDQENSLLQGEQKLAAEGQKTGDAQYKARLKAEQDYLKSLRKEEEAARKQELTLAKGLPTIPGGLWKSQADPLVNGANLVREKLPELIETYGVEGAYRIIAELDSATSELQRGYNGSSKAANALAGRLGQPIGNDSIESTTQEEYDAIWNNLNNSDRFSLDIDPSGQWIVSDQEDIKVPLRDWIQSSLTESAQSWEGKSKLNLYKGIGVAVQETYKGGIKESETALSSWLDDVLNPSNLSDPTKGKKHYLSALAMYAQDPENPTYEQLTDPNFPAEESRVKAVEQYKEKYMALAAKRKAEGSASSGSDVTAESVMAEGRGGRVFDSESMRGFLSDAFKMGPQDPERNSILGLSGVKGAKIQLGPEAAEILQLETDVNQLVAPMTVNAAAFNPDGDMFIQFRGRMLKTADELSEDQRRMAAAGIEGLAEEAGMQNSYGILEMGSKEWVDAVTEIGGKRVKLSNPKREAMQKKYRRENNGAEMTDNQIRFWVGLVSLGESTNPSYMQKVLKAIEENGITVEEIESLMD
tara:strand:+ start:225 stop:1910 length:1686 start_codon:yes stop_codon:yes gene_type:complete